MTLRERYDKLQSERNNLNECTLELLNSLQSERIALDMAKQDVESKTERLQQEKHDWDKVVPKLQQVHVSNPVKLNIGGTYFTTSVDTLRRQPGNFFEAMTSNRWPHQPTSDGSYFVDRDPIAFRHVLNFLREGEIDVSLVTKEELARLLKDADFYNLPQLLHCLQPEAPTLRFGHTDQSLTVSKEGLAVTSSTIGHRCATTSESLPLNGVTLVQLNIKCGHWIMVGVITHTKLPSLSYTDPGCYAWACSNQVYIAASNISNKEGWAGFQSGDKVVLKLDRDANLMSMKISRLATVFTISIPTGPLYIHVNLYMQAIALRSLNRNHTSSFKMSRLAGTNFKSSFENLHREKHSADGIISNMIEARFYRSEGLLYLILMTRTKGCKTKTAGGGGACCIGLVLDSFSSV